MSLDEAKPFAIELRELLLFSQYKSFGKLIDDFQSATTKDIAFMNNGEFLERLKKYIEKIRGEKYEKYEGLV